MTRDHDDNNNNNNNNNSLFRHLNNIRNKSLKRNLIIMLTENNYNKVVSSVFRERLKRKDAFSTREAAYRHEEAARAIPYDLHGRLTCSRETRYSAVLFAAPSRGSTSTGAGRSRTWRSRFPPRCRTAHPCRYTSRTVARRHSLPIVVVVPQC